MDFELAQFIGQIPIASAMLVGLIYIYRQSNKTLTVVLERQSEQDEQTAADAKTERETNAKLIAAERERAAERDTQMLALYREFVGSQKTLALAIDAQKSVVTSMLAIEQQNQKLLDRVVAGQADNSTSLSTLTGALDSAVAALGRIELAVTNGNGDHLTIAKTLVRVTAALGRIEAKLTPPTPKPDIPLHTPPASGDLQELDPAV